VALLPPGEPSSCAAGYIDVRAVHSGYDCTGDDPCIYRSDRGSIDNFPGRSGVIGARIGYRHQGSTAVFDRCWGASFNLGEVKAEIEKRNASHAAQ
jgi:hypothetical protein